MIILNFESYQAALVDSKNKTYGAGNENNRSL